MEMEISELRGMKTFGSELTSEKRITNQPFFGVQSSGAKSAEPLRKLLAFLRKGTCEQN